MLENKKIYLFSAVILKITLEISYWLFVSSIFSYAGFRKDFYISNYIESWVIYFTLLFFFPKKLIRPSDYLMGILLFSSIAPLLVFYALANASREHLYIVLLAVFLIAFFRCGKPLIFPYFKNGRIYAYIAASLLIVAVTMWLILSGGINYLNLDLTRVYEFRREAGEVINQGPMGYLNVWAMKVFGPFFLALSLWKKKYILAAMIMGTHVLWFGISAHKAVLFYPLLIIFLWNWFEKYKTLAFIPIGMTFALSVSLFLFLIFSEIFVASLFIRRVFFVPAFLTFSYYDFFSQNPFVFWSNSITSSFIKYPYHLNTADLIGNHLGNDAYANNSFLSTGYMHAGIAGMILYGILVGLLFRLIDSLAYKGVPSWVAVASIIVPSHALIKGTDLPTAIFTHGIGIALILLFLLRFSNENKSKPAHLKWAEINARPKNNF